MNGVIGFLACIRVIWVFAEFQSLVDGPGMSFAAGSLYPQACWACYNINSSESFNKGLKLSAYNNYVLLAFPSCENYKL